MMQRRRLGEVKKRGGYLNSVYESLPSVAVLIWLKSSIFWNRTKICPFFSAQYEEDFLFTSLECAPQNRTERTLQIYTRMQLSIL